MKKPALHWQILIAIIAALIFGALLPGQVKYVSWMGTVFIRLLRMIVIPLVLCSITSGIANSGAGKSLGRLGLKALIYYFSTSLLAILTGLLLVNTLKPGSGMGNVINSFPPMPEIAQKSLSDILFEIIPVNMFQAFSSNDGMLSVIFIAIITGIFITKLGYDNKVMLTGFFNAFFELMMKITMFIISLSPLGIFGLVAVMAGEQTANTELISGLGRYMITVVAGLGFHFLSHCL
jgi:Na+/H+-dicarboxylate symporter